MIRSRLASVSLALGLGLLSGCACCLRHPLLGHSAAATSDCGCGAGETMTEGPLLGDGLPHGFPSANPPGMILTPPPESAPPPRLVPQPQAQPAPYVPR